MRRNLRSRLTRSSAAIAFLAAAMAGGTGISRAADVVPVHIFSPFSGPIAFYGPSIRHGIELAIAEAGSKLKGRTIRLVDVDDECKPDKAVSAVNRILDDAVVLAGPVCTGNMLAIQRILVEEKIPHIFTGYGAVVTQKNDPFIVAASVSDRALSAAIIKWARENKNVKTWGLIHDTTGYGVAGARTFAAAVEASGSKLIKTVSYKPGEREYTGLLSSLDRAKPDAIYLIGYEVDLGIMVKQAGQAGMKSQLVGSAAFVNPELAKAAGAHAENIPFVTMMTPNEPTPQVQEFVKSFEAKFGAVPKDTGTIGYITGLILVDALSRIDGKVTRESLAKAIRETNIPNSPVGAIHFDSTGARVGKNLSVIGIVKDGVPTFLTRY